MTLAMEVENRRSADAGQCLKALPRRTLNA